MIYLDNAATTKIRGEVLSAMMPYLTTEYGNPSGVYSLAREAHSGLDRAREQMRRALNAKFAREIFFTSCGTESDNWAIKGTAYALADKGKHIITSKAEHHAVLETCAFLETQGFSVTYLDPDRFGMITADMVENAITEETILVSVMHANNEIGTINPIREIAETAHSHGILMHTDAVQSVGHIPVDVQELGVDLLSLSGHKFHAPKGVGALYIRSGCKLAHFMNGGAQERGSRAGTENLASIVGMGEAIRLACDEMQAENTRLAALRDEMIRRILSEIPDARLNGHPTDRLPGNLRVSFPNVKAELILFNMDLAGIACSGGSACTAGSIGVSHVLEAIKADPEYASGTVRFSFSRYTTLEEIDEAVNTLKTILRNAKK